MTGPLGALERSLRDGPPDEAGYRPEPLTAGQSTGRTQAAPAWHYLVAVLVVAVSIATLGIVGTRSQTGGDGPVSAPPGQVSPSPSAQASIGPAASAVLVPPLTPTFVSPRNGD